MSKELLATELLCITMPKEQFLKEVRHVSELQVNMMRQSGLGDLPGFNEHMDGELKKLMEITEKEWPEFKKMALGIMIEEYSEEDMRALLGLHSEHPDLVRKIQNVVSRTQEGGARIITEVIRKEMEEEIPFG